MTFNLNQEKLTIFDLSADNKTLNKINFNEKDAFTTSVSIYQWSELFDISETARTIHLGIDLWADAGVNIFCPLDAIIHSFQYNNNPGDYGPTIKDLFPGKKIVKKYLTLCPDQNLILKTQ